MLLLCKMASKNDFCAQCAERTHLFSKYALNLGTELQTQSLEFPLVPAVPLNRCAFITFDGSVSLHL